MIFFLLFVVLKMFKYLKMNELLVEVLLFLLLLLFAGLLLHVLSCLPWGHVYVVCSYFRTLDNLESLYFRTLRVRLIWQSKCYL